MKSSIKNSIKKMAKNTAVNSYGKSIPIYLYEAKVPKALKNVVEEKKF
ncbi:MAG: hypothetical protein J6J16_00845 [Lachnospiraceae bacterium]|nr:hypothetical protein [Lachnospiraceae bacterium]